MLVRYPTNAESMGNNVIGYAVEVAGHDAPTTTAAITAAMNGAREIALVTASYASTLKAWTAFRSALSLPDDADDIALRLALQRLRLEAWGRQAGPEQNDYNEHLHPVVELVDAVLKRIKKICLDGDQLQAKYGLGEGNRGMYRLKNFVSTNDGMQSGKDSRQVERFVSAIQQYAPTTKKGYRVADRLDAGSIAETASVKTNFTRFSTAKKARYNLKDRARFVTFVEAIDTYLAQLTALLTQSQQRAMAEEAYRMSIAAVGQVETRQSLSMLRRCANLGLADQVFSRMIDRKGISDTLEYNDFSESAITHRRQTSKGLISLSASDFYMPETTSSRRFLTSSRTWQGSIVLLERKDYPRTADQADLDKLDARIQRLALLLATSNADLDALRCLGYFTDSKNGCWWLAFDFPHRQKSSGSLQVTTRLTASTRPVSLVRLLCNKASRWRPSLGQRIKLASDLATTLSALYSSGWMHRSIRSANVLFPYMYTRKGGKAELEGLEDLSKPLLGGFEYSQQDQESWDGTIYRHPSYQSAVITNGTHRPRPYRVQFDIYSFGLVLVEIALWLPLLDFLDANAADFLDEDQPQGSQDPQDQQQPEGRTLGRKMEMFTPDDARELQRRVVRMVRKELGFSMGMQYRDAVKWCLQYADQDRLDGEGDDWHHALQFYDKVVVPLQRLTRMGES